MSTTINQYPFFENNQVLTSSQLNELSGYLDQQTRLSRVRLTGMGIVCGLQPSFTPDVLLPVPSNEGTETISAGTGITSEGYLINTGQCDFTQYRSYVLPSFADPYLPFIDPADNSQVTLWEMLPQSFVPDPGDPNPPLGRITKTFLDGATPGEQKIVLLFVEIADFDNKSCLGKSCDENGKVRNFTLRKLLISIDELRIVLQRTGTFALDFPAKFDLPDLKVLRALYDPQGQNTVDYNAFSLQYKTAVSNVYRQNFSDPSGIIQVLKDTYTIFEPILKDIYNNTNPFDSIPNSADWNNLVNGLNIPSFGPKFLGIQFFYDFIKDLVRAYDEFRDAAFEFMSDCCLDMGLFPQHLLLGEAIPVNNCKPSQYRNDLISIPTTPAQRVAKDKLLNYQKRIVLMIRKFNVALIHNPNMAAPPLTLITPSFQYVGKLSPLSMESIPYYYKIDEIDTQLQTTLEAVWNFDIVRRCKKDAFGQVPVIAYGNQSTNQSAAIDPIQTPLRYDIDEYNFLRIEGVLRKNYKAVITDLEDKKEIFNLPFNVVAVRLQGGSTREDILARCNFEDLRSQYVAYRNETSCRVSRLITYITVAKGQERTPRPLPDFILQLSLDSEQGGHGNSSVVMMPAAFIIPGTTAPAPHTGLLTYAPESIDVVKTSLTANITQLINRFSTIGKNKLLPDTLDSFDYGYTISDINLSFINSYLDAVLTACKIKADLNKLLDHVWHATKNQYPVELYFTVSQWASEYFYMLNEFINDCSFRKLEAVYYNFQYRLNYLLSSDGDPALFKNFVAKNPGLDHKAGVPLGGTFVLVYNGKSLNFDVKAQQAFAVMVQDTKNLEVELAGLSALPAKTEEQTSRMFVVQNKLCELYATIATAPHPRPKPSGIALPSLALQQIALGPEDIIADFCLPYLSNCDCDCLDIPAPKSEQLGIPNVILPAFYEYNLGDYAFAKEITGATYGCSTITRLPIDVSTHINYLGTRVGSGAFVRLKFVVKGADVPAVSSGTTVGSAGIIVDRAASVSINSEHGGTVTITDGNGTIQGFSYTPPQNFTGLDTFQYVFEVYDSQGNILRRSTVGKVLISVTTKCPAKIAVANTAFEPIPIG